MNSENHSRDKYEWSYNEQRMLRYMLEKDGMQFMRYFFKIREGTTMIRNWHHYVIEYVLQAVYELKITRLIVNIAPGYTKTEQAVINFITRGMVINPRSKFIHASYSSDLARENSSKIRETIQTPEFQDLWEMPVRVDTKAKNRWFTELGGGMMAAAAGGQITGFRAGRMEPGFTGALVLDDPVKPDDAYSNIKRTTINNRFNNTMRSRLAMESVPIVLTMQRLHELDLSGFLLRGGSGDKWFHLMIPTLLDEDTLNLPYPEEYTHGIPIDINRVLTCLRTGEQYDFQR